MAQYAPNDPDRAAVLGETWGQSIIPWSHSWQGDEKAKEDPRGGFQSDEEYLKAYKNAIEELITLQKTHGYNAVVMTQVDFLFDKLE